LFGGLFVVETLSVMIQVSYFRYSGGKRVFLMAPLHHHFEKKGWPESKVVIRFWIVSLVLALIGLSTLKCAKQRGNEQYAAARLARQKSRPLRPRQKRYGHRHRLLQAGAEVIAWDNGAAARTDTTCVTRICISWIGRLRVLPPWC
jgi:hypothetical protein